MEIRRSYDRLISTMEFPILVRCHLYIESGPSWKLIMGPVFNSLWPSDAMSCHTTWSPLVKCHLFGAKLLSQPMLM